MPDGAQREGEPDPATQKPQDPPSVKPPDLATLRTALIRLLDPPVFLVVIMLGGVSGALLREIFGYSGMLVNMRNPEYARGLITYLYAVVTIGTAVVLVVSALLGSEKVRQDDGRQILALLLGVFGTIVGFYFGNAVATAPSQATEAGLRLTPPLLSETSVVSGQTVHAIGAVSGGVPPYEFDVSVGRDSLVYSQSVGADGWMTADVEVPAVTEPGPVIVSLGVKDAAGTVLTTAKSVTARPKE